MKALEALNILGDMCASQRGLVTAAQAVALGVDRMAISRLAANGQLKQVARGVYRACGAPRFREEDVFAAWLSTDPRTPAYDRAVDSSGPVASHRTAAWLLGLGELKPEPLTFTCPRRRQTRNPNVRFVRREVGPRELTVAGGIPVTDAARTVVDLIMDGEDLSLVSGVLRDALDMGMVGDERSLASAVDELGRGMGIPQGESLYDRLKGKR